MLYYLATRLSNIWGPIRLLQSYAVLIILALYTGYVLSLKILPLCFDRLPHDRGRAFAQNATLAQGKPTGAGLVFISIFVGVSIFFVPMTLLNMGIVLLTWLTMLTGYLDDRSSGGWGEYRKALLDLAICSAATLLLIHCLKRANSDGAIHLWVPLVSGAITIRSWLFAMISVVVLWVSINTTNCTDGVDGLSGTLVLVALLTLGVVFYFILGHKAIAGYLLVPHIAYGANIAVMIFALGGTLMGYLWHNAYPSRCLMGDAGSRALGFFIGVCVMISGNPFMLLATQAIMLINGGMGLLKVALLRFCGIKIFSHVIFPLHDYVRKVRKWSATQVLIKFLIMQLLITVAVIGFLFKVR